ncbi:MAG: 5-(carboxyamino)imidazole ribonucleotide mutase [Gammaproteobacteria bacterium]|jgi:5-(carboxyamino)imidazole ribonucleotide mutase|tara:strand:+ start:10965 stop:11459 length:495 start_codon:yes stop_codon:yes gene_type:complete
MAENKNPIIGIVMGSDSDWPIMRLAAEILDQFNIAYESKIVSAHRTPDDMYVYAENAKEKGIKCIIAGAGGAAHLPGMLASKTELPILGVPIPTKHLNGNDSLLSIVQMPKGVPVATFAIGEAGASNSALFAISMLSIENKDLEIKLLEFRKSQTNAVLEKKLK